MKVKIDLPKLANGGIIKTPISSITPDEYIYGIFMTHKEMIQEIERQKEIINHLSRVIQHKNQKYRKLEAEKMPPTLYGREVIIVPDSMADSIMIVNKDLFDISGGIK